jgi:serine/threonine protein kinase
MNDCPPKEILEKLLPGALPPEEADTVQQHVVRCPRCQAVLDRLSDDPELQDWAVQARSRQADADDQSALESVVGALRSSSMQRAAPKAASGPPATALGFLGPADRPGDLGCLGTYAIEAELGRGGMGIVLRAFDPALQRRVAVKVLRPDRADDQAKARFVQEARAAAQLNHDHVVRIHAVVNPPEGVPYFIMEYVAGPTLTELVRSKGSLPPGEAVGLIVQIADGLVAAHAAGLIHRDVKPSNILIDPDTGRAKITDFGLARLGTTVSKLTQEGVLAGTPAYMSPEQVQASEHLDGRTDVYSLGMTLYEALTGKNPFHGAAHVVLQQVLAEEPRPPRQLDDRIPRDVETICLKALAKEPNRRYQTAAEFAEDLRRWQRGEPVRARPTGRVERLWRWCRRRPRVAALSAALVIAILTGLGGILWERQRGKASAAAALAKSDQAVKLTGLAWSYLLNGRAAEAEKAYREAIALLKETAAANPTLLVHQLRLVTARNGLALSCQLLGRTSEARSTLQTALATAEELVHTHPEVPEAIVNLVVCQLNFGHLLTQEGNAEAALAWHGKALDAIDRFVKSQPHTASSLRPWQCLVYVARAYAFVELGCHADAVADWDRAIAADSSSFPHLVPFLRAISDTRISGRNNSASYAEHYAASVNEMEAADRTYALFGTQLMHAGARVCALASSAAAVDTRLPESDRLQRADQYAAKAVAYLKRAQAQGYFRLPDRVQALKSDKELDSLRSRADFQALLTTVEKRA